MHRRAGTSRTAKLCVTPAPDVLRIHRKKVVLPFTASAASRKAGAEHSNPTSMGREQAVSVHCAAHAGSERMQGSVDQRLASTSGIVGQHAACAILLLSGRLARSPATRLPPWCRSGDNEEREAPSTPPSLPLGLSHVNKSVSRGWVEVSGGNRRQEHIVETGLPSNFPGSTS